MSSEWKATTLGELCAAQEGSIQTGPFGSQLHASDYVADGVPVVMPANIDVDGQVSEQGIARIREEDAIRLSQHRLKVGDIVFSRRGDVTRNALAKSNQVGWLCGTGCLKVRTGNGAVADASFLSYALRTPDAKAWLVRHAVGATMPNLNTGILSGIPLVLPPLAEQRSITAILSALDDRITLLRETNTTLESIAQALFKSWFVDFDSVRAKMAGRAPEGMDEATAALFPDSFEDSELGEVPRGWGWVPFGSLLAHTIGGDWGSDSPEAANDTKVAIIRGTDIPDLQQGAAGRVPIRYTSQKKLKSRQLQDGDLVVEVSGGSKDQPTGRSLYVTTALLDAFSCPVEPASFCRLFRPHSKEIGVLLAQHLQYIYGQGKTWEYQNQSTGIANFQTTHFLESEQVAMPPHEVLEVFAQIVRALIDRARTAPVSTLSTLRDTLLPRLISGQLRLPEATEAVDHALATIP